MPKWLSLSSTIFHPSHGPTEWPWFRLLVIHVVRTQPFQGWYNIWFYTRWGAMCQSIKLRNALKERVDG